jgi:hypothetical protein
MATEITAKGDLIAGTGSATFENLAVGTNGQTIVADSTASTGLKGATPSGGGKVLQVVYASTNTSASSSSSSFADTGLTATITPTLNTSKILVIVNQNGVGKSGANANNAVAINLLRGATTLINLVDIAAFTGTALLVNAGTGASGTYLDSPATTSATTYKTQFSNPNNTASVFVQDTFAGSLKSASTITLMEIGA